MDSLLNDRNRNIMDGTYAAVPDLHSIQPSKYIGLRKYNNSILIHNWYEERNTVSIYSVIRIKFNI